MGFRLDEATFNYDFYTLPINPEVGYRQVMHVDDLHMVSSVKEENKQAAYEFIKFGTFGTAGILSSFEYRDTLENPSPYVYFPPVKNNEISTYFNNLEQYPDRIKYMYNNQDKSFRGDSW